MTVVCAISAGLLLALFVLWASSPQTIFLPPIGSYAYRINAAYHELEISCSTSDPADQSAHGGLGYGNFLHSYSANIGIAMIATAILPVFWLMHYINHRLERQGDQPASRDVGIALGRRGQKYLFVAAILSFSLFVSSIALWIIEPGYMFLINVSNHQFSFNSVRGRLMILRIDLVWPPPAGSNALSVLGQRWIVDIPLWPIVIGSAVLPIVWMKMALERRSRSRLRGFPIS
jgi:uncharacterized membrane protein